MRLLQLRLQNYIGIYNGMGLNVIDIDFRKCKNNIVVIKGDNGTGKSTIYNAMNPLPDDRSNYIEGIEASKLIEYLLDDGTRLTIFYTSKTSSNGNRYKTTCSITRFYPDGNVVELNPSFNINTGKDIIYELFDLDDNFLALSALSANRKGLGGLKPGDRKKYVNTIIDTLEDYNSLYKTMSKKSIALKSMLNSITSKLSQVSNVEMIKSRIDEDNLSLNNLDRRRNELMNHTSYIKAQLDEINPNDDITKRYESLLKEKNSIQEEYKQTSGMEIKEYSEEELLQLEKDDSKLEASLELLENSMNGLLDKEKSIRSDIDTLNIKLNSLFDSNLLESTKKKIEEEKEKLKFYKDRFESLGFNQYENITEQEYIIALDAIENINNHIASLGDEYPLYIIEESCTYIINPAHMRSMDSLQNELNSMKNKCNELEDKYNNSISDELFDKNSFHCDRMNDCPAIKILLKKEVISQQEYRKLTNSIKTIKDYISELEEEKDRMIMIYKCSDEIKSLINYIQSMYKIICKFPNTDIFKDYKSILHSIESLIPININLEEYREYMNYIDAICVTTENIKAFTEVVDKMMSSNVESIVIKQQLENLNSNLQEVMNSKSTLLDQITNTKNNKLQIKTKLDEIRLIKANLLRYNEITEKYKKLDEEIDKISIDIEKYNSLSKVYSEETMELNRIISDIDILRKTIEENKYKLVIFDQYRSDYEEYSVLYNSVQQIKYYSSINGIQTKYMTVYMNDILSDTNTLLERLFNGSFRLQPFVINDTEFRIPCIDTEGNLRYDISLMSDSQVSMISMLISFALLHKASKFYNIIKLDEVDNNLDIDNRLQFSILINNIMNILRFDQCIIISHNNELDLSNMDMIIFRIQDDEVRRNLYNSGANIIYDYNKN